MTALLPPEVFVDILFFSVGPPAEHTVSSEYSRKRLRDHRLTVVQVCRHWKKTALKYVYLNPYLPTPSSLRKFTTCLLSADRKWDNLRFSPFSLPGAYVQTLDLSHLSYEPFSSVSLDRPWIQNQLLCQLIPLLPYVEKLVLPSAEQGGLLLSGGMFLRCLKAADLSVRLKTLEGVGVLMNGVVDGEGLDPLVSVLQSLPNLEKLGVVGGGGMDMPPSEDFLDNNPQPVLDLPRLAHLSLKGIRSSLLLQTLLLSPLPSLRTLKITSYNTTDQDLTTPFLSTHGEKLVSLTYLPLPDFPQPSIPFPQDTLLLCPNLRSIQFHTFPPHLAPDISFFSPSHPLTDLTLPRPATPSALETTLALVRSFANQAVLPSLRTIQFTKFNWVNHPLGAACQAGTNGVIRDWAVLLGKRGVGVLDSKGRVASGMKDVRGKWMLGASTGVGVRGERRSSVRSLEDEESDGGG